MVRCPDCSDEIADQTSICPSCGTNIGGDQTESQPEQRSSSSDEQPSGQQPPNASGNGQRPEAGQSDGLVTRRNLLLGGALAAGGYFLFSDSSGSQSPEEVTLEFERAVRDADRGRAQKYAHPDRSVEEILGVAFRVAWGANAEIRGAELIEQEQDTARVERTVYNIDNEYLDTDSYHLRKGGGSWKIWDYNPIN